MGSMTGRGAGHCAGRGFAGNGRGRRNMFHATGLTGWQRAAMNAAQTPTAAPAEVAQTEKQSLEAGVAAMQAQLDVMKQRLAEIETQQT
jgi:hypothetical protein